MAEDSGDATLIKIAIFGLAMSLLCTAFISVLFVSNGDYDYEDVTASRQELIQFSGETMLNQTPWQLTHVYTPWNNTYESDRIDADHWLYGEEITDYPYLHKSADIRLSPEQKSSVPLTYVLDAESYRVDEGYKWWAGLGSDPEKRGPFGDISAWLFGEDSVKNFSEGKSNQWNFTGYRYVFDPMLPFTSSDPDSGEVSTVDGALNIVWYNYGGTEGLSGGLQIYGGKVLLASYTAADIVTDYNSSTNYASVYDFDFQGTMLALSIRFDPAVIEAGTSLMQAWTNGDWSMAISSPSAGNFFDIDGSSSFTTTAGGMIQTFINIYTFNLPSIQNPWMDVILWLLVGLPMTMAMALITLRLINGFRVL